MSKKEYLHLLFKTHLADLKSVRPDISDMFICPICLRMFPEDAINQGYLTDGHIWPTDFRKTSRVANNQAVLLCRWCNHSSGSRGDAHMQLYEKLKDGEKSGELFGIRTVELIEKPGDRPIRMRVKVTRNGEDSISIIGSLDENLHWRGSSQEDQARFEDLAKRSMEMQQQFTVIVNPSKEYNPNLASAGWITAAYLTAFYTLGYGYIFHPGLDFVRDYITSSFEPDDETNLSLLEKEDFHIDTRNEYSFQDPAIRITIPIGRNENVRLDVCFQNHIIRLPIFLEPKVFEGYWSLVKRQLQGQQLPPVKEGDTPYVYDYLHCTKTIEHTCIYDYLLGKPLPYQQGA